MLEEHAGPYLVMALFCEKVLQEQNGVLSIIRVVDQVNISGPLEEMQPTPITLNVVISFKAGIARGKYRIRLRGHTPTQKEIPTMESSAYFEGEDRGVNLVLVVNMLLQEEGIFWFDVMLEDAVVTRMPLRILYQRVATPGRPERS